jgi:hypothetical protein
LIRTRFSRADGCHCRCRPRGRCRNAFGAWTIAFSDHGRRSCGGRRLADSGSRFKAAFNRSPAIRQVVQLHIRAMLAQFQLGVACNALHPVQARMARWLLQFRNRTDHDVLPLTQEALSQILGVRRTTVTLLMHGTMTRELDEILSIGVPGSRIPVPPPDVISR